MQSNTRAIVAAAAYAIVTGTKVAGIYDHGAERHLRIAAENRGDRVQALDDERSTHFGGILPDLYDDGAKAFISLEIDGATVRGYDRSAAGFYEARVADGLVEFYDHGENAWFAFTVQTA